MTTVTPTAAVAPAPPIQIGRVISNTLAALRQDLGTYLILGVVFAAVPTFAAHILLPPLFRSADQVASFMGGYLTTAIEGLCVYPLIAGVTLGVIAHLRGKRLSLGACLKAGLGAWFSLFALFFVMGLVEILGLILLVIPGLVLAVIWSVAVPVRLVEKRGVGRTLDRSRILTRGRRWSIVGLVVIFLVAIFVFSLILGVVGALVAMATSHSVNPIPIGLTASLDAIIQMATQLLGAAGGAALYHELKTTREGDEPKVVASIFE